MYQRSEFPEVINRPHVHNYLNVNILSWNISGLKKHCDSIELKKYFENFDVLNLSETWSDFKGEFDNFFNGYYCFDNVRKKKGTYRNNGGICIFVKKSFLDNKFLERIYEETADCVTLRIIGSSQHDMVDIVMVFAYISPEGSYIYDNSDFDGIQLLEKHLLTIKSNFSDALLFIAGDLNARTELFLDYIPDDNLKFIFGDVIC